MPAQQRAHSGVSTLKCVVPLPTLASVVTVSSLKCASLSLYKVKRFNYMASDFYFLWG